MSKITSQLYLIFIFAALLVLQLTSHKVKACSSEGFTSSYGEVICPNYWFSSTYDHNMDAQWRLYDGQAKTIRFSTFHTESNLDKVSIYEGIYVSDSSELFRLSGSSEGVVNSVFWLPRSCTVRFRTDGSVSYTGFRFTFAPSYSSSILVGTEVIGQNSGERTSHPGYGSDSYSNNFKVARSIECPYYSYIAIRFLAFDTETNHDFLTIYRGTLTYQGTPLHRFSGHLTSMPTLQFFHGITLVFTTDGSNVGSGFKFEFSRHGFVSTLPEAVSFEPISPGLWTEAHPIQIYATTSTASCPMVVHQCELRTVGAIFSTTHETSFIVSTSGTCLKRTRLEFRGQDSDLIATSVIACRLLDNRYAVKPVILPEPQDVSWKLDNWTGRVSSGSFHVSLTPGLGVTTATCVTGFTDHLCDTEARERNTYVYIGNLTGRTTKFDSGQSHRNNSENCVTRISCTFSALNGWKISRSIAPERAFPTEVLIRLIDEDSWSPDSSNRFSATSDNVCPSVRHTCELWSGNVSLLSVEPVGFTKSPENATCSEVASIETIFALPINTSVLEDYFIACSIAGDRFSVKALQSDAERFAMNLQKARRAQLKTAFFKSVVVLTIVAMALSLVALVFKCFRSQARAASGPDQDFQQKLDANRGEPTGTQVQNATYVNNDEFYVV